MELDQKDEGLPARSSSRSMSLGDLRTLVSEAVKPMRRNSSIEWLSQHFTENMDFSDQHDEDVSWSSTSQTVNALIETDVQTLEVPQEGGLTRRASTGSIPHAFQTVAPSEPSPSEPSSPAKAKLGAPKGKLFKWLTTQRYTTIADTITESTTEDEDSDMEMSASSTGNAASLPPMTVTVPIDTKGQISAAASEMVKTEKGKSSYRDLNVYAPSYW